MDIHYLKIFNIFATELSFSKTANILYISQPAVSMQIKKLEMDLGCKLFDKIGKQIYLNENGRVLYEYTSKIFALIREAENRLSGMNVIMTGTVNIGASNTPGSYILPKILGEFMEMYPEVNTNLHVGNTSEIERMILENKIDFAVNGGDIQYGSQIHVEKLMEDSINLVCSPSCRLTARSAIEGHELAKVRLITHERNSQLYSLAEKIYKELGFPIKTVMMLGSIDAIKQAVIANLGISVIPGSAIRQEFASGILKRIKIKGREWRYPYNLIYHQNRFLSAAALQLISLVREKMHSPVDKEHEFTE